MIFNFSFFINKFFFIFSGVIDQGGQRHSHEPNHISIEVQAVVLRVKRKAEENPNMPPSAIFRAEVSHIRNEEVIANLPEKNHLIRNINRVQNRSRPANPVTVNDIVILPPYDRTISGQLFYQHDASIGNEENERFIVFYTENALEKLCNSAIILCDGTLKVSLRFSSNCIPSMAS